MAAADQSAASSSSEDDEKNEQAKNYEELDFCSPKFNPLKALFSPNVKIPYENVKAFPSIATYEAAVNRKSKTKDRTIQTQTEMKTKADVSRLSTERKTTEGSLITNKSQQMGGASTLRVQNSKGALHNVVDQKSADRPKTHFTFGAFSTKKEMPQGRSKVDKNPDSAESLRTYLSAPPDSDRHDRNVLIRMAQTSGPLELLTRCVKERLHVRVVTRAAVSVRSICRGYIMAFDKYFNMALIDVDEIYRRPACLGKVRARRTHKLQAAQKTLEEEREEQLERFNAVNLSSTETGVSAEGQTVGKESQFTKLKEGKGSAELNENKLTSNVMGQKATKEKRQTSVYENVPAPFSNFEREALMLGIPDENVNHRHVNQLFIRGENIVLVSIIDN